MPRLRSAIALALLALCLAISAGAQQNRAPSDAVVLVAPLGGWVQGNGQIAVSVSFPRTEDHAALRRRMQSLGAACGWRLLSAEAKEEDVRAGKYSARQTGVTAMFAGPVPWRGGGFWLQPFVDAFRDLSRFQLLFLAPADGAFQGLREFRSPALDVRLEQSGGPYRYAVEVRSHSGQLPTLPLTQPRRELRPRQALPRAAASPVSYGPVLVLAGAAGLLVLGIMLVRLRLRAARVGDAPYDRSTKPPFPRRAEGPRGKDS